MESVEYDLDTSGGLMPQIQQLISPPALSDDCLSQKKDRRYRRPGRTVNHDNCDSCKEGGDLICCDRCPAAFHLQCHDPPLTDDDLPSGEWLCHRCKHSPKTEEKSMAVEGQQQKILVDSKSVTEEVSKGEEKINSHSELMVIREVPSTVSAFKRIIEDAVMMNPNQFELPPDLMCTTPLPGCGKRMKTRETTRSGKKLSHDLDNGLVPLPAKLCFHCRRSCYIAPLIQCDYCPLLFHADCLDPPLTALPTGKWMCPNHAEHTVDEKLLASTSFTERVKIWDKYSGNVNPGALLLRFLNKATNRAPPFRQRVKLKQRLRAKVPAAIIEQYNKPVDVLPSGPDLAIVTHTANCSDTCSLDDEKEWLSSIVSFQGEVARSLTFKPESPVRTCENEVSKCDVTTTMDTTSSELECCDVKPSFANQNGPTINSDCTNGDIEYLQPNYRLKNECKNNASDELPKTNTHLSNASFSSASAQLKSLVIPNRTVNSGRQNSVTSVTKVLRTSITNCGPQSSYEPMDCQSLNHTRVINSSAMKSLSHNDSTCVMQDQISSTSSTKLDLMSSYSNNFTTLLQTALDGMEDVQINKMDVKLVQALAYQRLQQIYPDKCTRKPDAFSDLTEVRARAQVLPFMGKGPSISMCYRTLNIGVGADMDVCLSNYGHCNFVSPKHACIFYDEVTRQYELLNYSEYGTTVDNVMYSCDLSQKQRPSISPNSLSHSVRKLAKSTPRLADLPPPPPITLDRPTMCSKIRKGNKACHCRHRGPYDILESTAGWEGTAIVHHGSYIKCGCLQFVFSITDYSMRPLLMDDAKSDELTCTASSNTSTASSSNASLLED